MKMSTRLGDPIRTPEAAELKVTPVHGQGPEDVLVDERGVVTGLADGRLIRIRDTKRPTTELLASTGGRPLGLEWLPDGCVLVCDACRGLLRVNLSRGEVGALAREVDDRAGFCNNAAVARDGTIYYSESSRTHRLPQYKADVVERSATGRLLRRDTSGTTDVLLDGLEFANGVALAHDESFVAVAETGRCRVWRVWLSGPRAGQGECWLRLPGMPDNLSVGSDNMLWVALPMPRTPGLRLGQRTPQPVRKILGRAANHLDPPDGLHVVAVDPGGHLSHEFDIRRCGYRMVTGVREYGGELYLGSLFEHSIATVKVPEIVAK